MKEDLQLKLQAYLDGELSAVDRTEMESLLAQDPEARALVAELRHTFGALAAYESDLKLPESREFYWSKIQREINRQPAPTAVPELSLGAWLRRILVPAGAFAAVTIAVLLTLPRTDGGGDTFADATEGAAFTYQNYATGTTLVWLDYPAENELSEQEWDDILDL
jgi:anti-sigma factor RsiW